MPKLIMFEGRECPHCRAMIPLLDRLAAEEGIALEKHEVWHDEKNAELMRSYRDLLAPRCGGQLRVPAFINTETQEAMCGEVDYGTLKAWAGK